jgi:hypothetical protein
VNPLGYDSLLMIVGEICVSQQDLGGIPDEFLYPSRLGTARLSEKSQCERKMQLSYQDWTLYSESE